MTLPLDHNKDIARLAAEQLFADVVARLEAEYPSASPELVRELARVFTREQRKAEINAMLNLVLGGQAEYSRASPELERIKAQAPKITAVYTDSGIEVIDVQEPEASS